MMTADKTTLMIITFILLIVVRIQFPEPAN